MLEIYMLVYFCYKDANMCEYFVPAKTYESEQLCNDAGPETTLNLAIRTQTGRPRPDQAAFACVTKEQLDKVLEEKDEPARTKPKGQGV